MPTVIVGFPLLPSIMGRSSFHSLSPFGAHRHLQTLASEYCAEGRPSHPILTQKTCAKGSSMPSRQAHPSLALPACSASASPQSSATRGSPLEETLSSRGKEAEGPRKLTRPPRGSSKRT